MNDAPERIWVNPECADRYYEGFAVSASPAGTIGIPDTWPSYILDTPEALAKSDTVRALVKAAEARGMERAAAKLHWLWNADGTKTERRVAEESAVVIRAEAAALSPAGEAAT